MASLLPCWTLRLPPEYHAALTELARRAGRSRAGLLLDWVEREALAQLGERLPERRPAVRPRSAKDVNPS